MLAKRSRKTTCACSSATLKSGSFHWAAIAPAHHMAVMSYSHVQSVTDPDTQYISRGSSFRLGSGSGSVQTCRSEPHIAGADVPVTSPASLLAFCTAHVAMAMSAQCWGDANCPFRTKGVHRYAKDVCYDAESAVWGACWVATQKNGLQCSTMIPQYGKRGMQHASAKRSMPHASWPVGRSICQNDGACCRITSRMTLPGSSRFRMSGVARTGPGCTYGALFLESFSSFIKAPPLMSATSPALLFSCRTQTRNLKM